jgi:hypothetical protein
MASGDTLRTTTLIESNHGNPKAARVEERNIPDANNNPIIRRRVAVFSKDSSNLLVNWELSDEFVMPSGYANTTGLTVDVIWLQEINGPLVGNVVWEAAVESLLTATALNVMGADNFGTPTVAAAQAVPGTLGQIAVTSIAIPKANAGPQILAAGTTLQLVRVRVRRLTVISGALNPLDTLATPALVLGIRVRET